MFAESSPECSIVGEQTEAVSENSCGLPVDDLTLVCRVRYSGDVSPELVWKDGDDVVHSRTDVLDNIARNSITIKPKWDRRMYSCGTNRSRSRCYVPAPRPLCEFSQRNILFYLYLYINSLSTYTIRILTMIYKY